MLSRAARAAQRSGGLAGGWAGREQKSLQLLFFLAANSAAGVDRDKAAEALLAEDDRIVRRVRRSAFFVAG